MDRAELISSYTEALGTYLSDASEPTLERAYELGRLALENGFSSTDLVAAYHHALRSLGLASIGGELVQGRKERFLIESLGPLEMTRYGYAKAERERQRYEEEALEPVAEAEEGDCEPSSVNDITRDLLASLRAILGYSRTLEVSHGSELSPSARRCVEAISSGAIRATEIVSRQGLSEFQTQRSRARSRSLT
jgi:hypothetical protein